jgi:hypothetical protein
MFTQIGSGGSGFSVAWLNRLIQAITGDRLRTGGRGILSGLAISAGAGLSLTIAEGYVMIDGEAMPVDDFAHVLPNNQTNYVWLTVSWNQGSQEYVAEVLLTATSADPGPTYVCLGMVTTTGGTITSVSTAGRVDLARWDGLRAYSIGGDLLSADLLDRRVTCRGAQACRVRGVTATGDILADDHIILANSAAGAITLTLPAAASVPGRLITVKRAAGGNNVTVEADGADTLDGGTNVVLGALYDAVRLVSFGNAWLKV